MGKKRRRKNKSAAGASDATVVAPAAQDDTKPAVADVSTDSALAKKSRPSELSEEQPPAAADQVVASQADAEEKERIANQKKLQKMVIRMRQRGKSEKEIRKAKIAFKREVNMRKRIANPATQPRANPKPKKMTKREQHVAEWKARNQTDAQIKGKKHNLVIVPVLWRHKEEESDDIMAACATIKKYLSSYGLDVWIDERTKCVLLLCVVPA